MYVLLFIKHKSYRNKLEEALCQLTKQVYWIRGNPKHEKLYEAIDIPWSEELVSTRNYGSKLKIKKITK